MSRDLRDAAEYERAKKLVRQLESQAKSLPCECHRATATSKAEMDRPGTCRRCLLWARALSGAEALLSWEWGEAAPAKPVEVLPQIDAIDPRVRDFTDWWELNQETYESWIDGFLWWVQPLDLPDADFWQLMGDAMDEYHRREAYNPAVWGRWEPAGMIVTSLEQWYESDEAA